MPGARRPSPVSLRNLAYTSPTLGESMSSTSVSGHVSISVSMSGLLESGRGRGSPAHRHYPLPCRSRHRPKVTGPPALKASLPAPRFEALGGGSTARLPARRGEPTLCSMKRALITAILSLPLWLAIQGCSRAAAQPSDTPAPPKIGVAEVVSRDIVEWDEFTGRLEAVHAVEIGRAHV